jgi:superfamily II DNA or RNA helicase
VIAHRTELLDQAAEKLAAVGVRASIDQGANKAPLNGEVVVASLQTLRGDRLERYAHDHFAFIVVDEAHHAAAKSYQGILEWFPAARVLGVTATPKRTDGKALGDTFETEAFTYALRTAIRDQFLAPIRARRVTVDVDLSRVKSHHGDFDAKQLSEILIAEKSLHEFVSR